MPTHSDDRILWILVGLGLIFAAKVIPAHLQYVRQLTQVTSEDEPDLPSDEDIDHALTTRTLQTLAGGRNYEIRSSAIRIIAERCISGRDLSLLLDDLAGGVPDRRHKAINALKLFVSHRSLQDSKKLPSLVTVQTFHAIVTALVKLLPQHQRVHTATASGNDGKTRCYQMDQGMPTMSRPHYEEYMKRAEQMARDCAERPKERAILCRIPAQQKQLLALTGLTPLTEYILNNNAHDWLREDGVSLVTLDKVPDLTDDFRQVLRELLGCPAEMEELSDWHLNVFAADRLRNVESIIKALRSSESLAVQASAVQTAMVTEAHSFEIAPGRATYDAYCQERAAYFRQLTGGLFQQALQSADIESATIEGKIGSGTPNGNDLPPSPIRPSCRPPQERTLLLIIIKLLNLTFDVEMALDTGLISRWLYRYPFPCMLHPTEQNDVVAFLRDKAWGSDEPVMAELMRLVATTAQGQAQLREYGLTKITNFHAYWHGGDLYGEAPSTPTHDVVMAGGEDTAGILSSTAQSGWDQRPGSSWSRSHPRIGSWEAMRRRRRREAMVLSDGDEPLTEGNILQRENSRVALVPGESLSAEEQLTDLIRAVDRDDQGAADQIVADGAAQGSWRLPLADITGVDDRRQDQ